MKSSLVATSHINPGSLDWASVANVDLGYCQVKIVAVRMDGEALDICKDDIRRDVLIRVLRISAFQHRLIFNLQTC